MPIGLRRPLTSAGHPLFWSSAAVLAPLVLVVQGHERRVLGEWPERLCEEARDLARGVDVGLTRQAEYRVQYDEIGFERLERPKQSLAVFGQVDGYGLRLVEVAETVPVLVSDPEAA